MIRIVVLLHRILELQLTMRIQQVDVRLIPMLAGKHETRAIGNRPKISDSIQRCISSLISTVQTLGTRRYVVLRPLLNIRRGLAYDRVSMAGTIAGLDVRKC